MTEDLLNATLLAENTVLEEEIKKLKLAEAQLTDQNTVLLKEIKKLKTDEAKQAALHLKQNPVLCIKHARGNCKQEVCNR